jgi:hypothetical protein
MCFPAGLPRAAALIADWLAAAQRCLQICCNALPEAFRPDSPGSRHFPFLQGERRLLLNMHSAAAPTPVGGCKMRLISLSLDASDIIPPVKLVGS